MSPVVSVAEGATSNAAAHPVGPQAAGAIPTAGPQPENPPSAGKWFFIVGGINSYPRLAPTGEEARTSIELPFRMVSPWFGDFETFPDFRDKGLIWTPYAGLGRHVTEKWTLFVQAGFSGTTLRTEDCAPSIVLLPFVYDVRFKRNNFMCGVGSTYYPWNPPAARAYRTWRDRLKNTRPFVTGTLNYNRITADTRVVAGIAPLTKLVQVRQKDCWESASLSLTAGISVPLSATSSVNLGAQRLFFFNHGDDFSGPGFTIAYKYAWGGKDKKNTSPKAANTR